MEADWITSRYGGIFYIFPLEVLFFAIMMVIWTPLWLIPVSPAAVTDGRRFGVICLK